MTRIALALVVLVPGGCSRGGEAGARAGSIAAEPRGGETTAAAEEAASVVVRAEALDGAEGPDIELRRIGERVWLHDSSIERDGYGRIQANGLVVVGERGAVIVDSSWTEEQTGWLLERVRAATGREALALVATHFHDDRASGAKTARAAGVDVHASARTKALLGADGEAIDRPFESRAMIDLGDRRMELFFPGAGHSPDNIVVHVPEEDLLFGGCLIRAAESDWIGYLGDADVPAWPATMDRLIERYGDAAVVVPGHGAIGDASLLEHTRGLATEASR